MAREEELARMEKEIAEQMVKIENLKDQLKAEKEKLATYVEDYSFARMQDTLDVTEEPKKPKKEKKPKA